MGIRSKGGALPAGAAGRILARRDEKPPKKPKRVRGMSDEAWDAYDLAWKKRRAAQKRWAVFSGQITVKGQRVNAIIARPPVKMVVKHGIGDRTEALRKAQERAKPRLPGLN